MAQTIPINTDAKKRTQKENKATFMLSCDGGGVRGVATAQFLFRLEQALGEKLCDIFDIFVGTSTGGIIALGLGLMKYDAEQVLELYSYQNMSKIMPPSSSSYYNYLFGWTSDYNLAAPRFDGVGKTEMLKGNFKDKKFGDTDKELILTSYDVEARKPLIWKNKHPSSDCSSADPSKVLAYQIADATSAAPTYFPTVAVETHEIDPNTSEPIIIKKWCIDGGVIANNPVMCGYSEVCKHRKGDLGNIVVLSVGTGKRMQPIPGEASRHYGAIEWMRHDLLGVVMDTSVVEYEAKHMLSVTDESYLRVNSDLTVVEEDKSTGKAKVIVDAKESLDCVTHENIDQLKKLGDYWWEKYGDQAVRMLKSGLGEVVQVVS